MSGLEVRGLSVRYPIGGLLTGRRVLQAVTDVSFDLIPGQTLGLVGESGCGKSSVARALVRLAPVSEGSVIWQGRDLAGLNEAQFRKVRPDIQMVFQDPFAALNPRMNMSQLIAEPLVTQNVPRAQIDKRVAAIVDKIGLRPEMMTRYPHEFSGGQAQRIGIARAVICNPRVLICDEAVSALDVSVQALILDLLTALQEDLSLAMLFIGHDLSVVRLICDRVMVLYLGRVMEEGPVDTLFDHACHPYTQLLIGSALSTDPEVERGRVRPAIRGDLPSPMDPPSGCVFRTRCPLATGICAAEVPVLREIGGTRAACHHAEEAL